MEQGRTGETPSGIRTVDVRQPSHVVGVGALMSGSPLAISTTARTWPKERIGINSAFRRGDDERPDRRKVDVGSVHAERALFVPAQSNRLSIIGGRMREAESTSTTTR